MWIGHKAKGRMELSEEASETEASDEEDSCDEEPRIKDVLENISQTVSRKRASDLLHSMAASKDILFWTPRGQLFRNKRIIPVTNIAELVKYILLPHNDDVTKPRALNTFLDGLAVSRWASFILSFLRNTTSCQHGGSNPSPFFHVFSGIPNDVIHAGLYKCFLSWSDFSMTLLRQVLFYVTSNKN